MKRLPKVRVVSIALPIGNFEDLSFRAARLLSEAQIIFCEDTRKVKSLLEHHKIASRAKWISIPGDEEWNFDFTKLASGMTDGDLWTLVSDAGTPVVNDPGKALVEWTRTEAICMEIVPGPSAVTAALQWSGGFGLPWVFLGFAPKEKNAASKEWDRFFAGLQNVGTAVFFDTKHQVLTTLKALQERNRGSDPLFVAREITKEHEELLWGTVDEIEVILRKRLEKDEPIGELTLILKGLEISSRAVTVTLEQLRQLRSAPTKEASKIAAEISGLSARECYQAFIEDKK
jgi:16S rRNA (cytidine1402-2'-O)-methyltransferase